MYSQLFLIVLILSSQAASEKAADAGAIIGNGRSKMMGSLFSLLSGRSGTPDPITGLTTKETKLIQTSYSKVMENAIENGMAIMIRLFEKHPKYKKLFPFRDVPDDKLKESANFKVHCSRIMYNLREVVDNLDDGDLVVAMLDKIATNHKKHKAPAQGFQDLKIVFIDILSTLFPSDTLDAWKKLLDLAMGYISQQLS